MGIVFKAEEPQPRRLVAIKVMRPEQATPLSRQRFLREGQALASVEHERIVPVYRVDEMNGVPFLVMPLLQGESLQARLERDGRLPLAEVLRIGREAAEGLAAAHAAGVVHRDVKPSNIWLRGAENRVVLLDFGLARAAAPQAGDAADLTGAGSVLGTAGYMAPEQAAGRAVDARADLFSLGCVLYELCTARRPFTGPDPLAILSALANHHPSPPASLEPRVPPALSALVMRLLAKSPDERPQSAAQLVAALRVIEQARGEIATTTDFPVRAPAVGPRRSWPWVGLAAAVVVLGAIAPLTLVKRQVRPPPAGHSAPGDSSPKTIVAGAGTASAAPLEVLTIDVQHYARLNENDAEPRGILGKQSFTPKLGDQVTVEARLSRPAYAYLLAFRPDGVIDLCFPDDESQPPPFTNRPRYPSRSSPAEVRYGLQEGIGLWVIAVVVSEKPLPAYRDFIARTKWEWPRQSHNSAPADSATVWWYDGQRVEPLTGAGAPAAARGKGEKALGTSASVVGAADWLKAATHGEAIAAIGFVVRVTQPGRER